jgi:hypothetical protein
MELEIALSTLAGRLLGVLFIDPSRVRAYDGRRMVEG